jgi:hypothetical protein
MRRIVRQRKTEDTALGCAPGRRPTRISLARAWGETNKNPASSLEAGQVTSDASYAIRAFDAITTGASRDANHRPSDHPNPNADRASPIHDRSNSSGATSTGTGRIPTGSFRYRLAIVSLPQHPPAQPSASPKPLER